jgi:hypothetical protein
MGRYYAGLSFWCCALCLCQDCKSLKQCAIGDSMLSRSLTLILLCKIVSAQNIPSPKLSAASYTRLLNMVLPPEYPRSQKLDYLFILRFEPNEGTESQLDVRAWHDGRVEATLSTIKGVSAWRVANDYIARTGKENLVAITDLIKAQTHPVNFSRSDLEKWHSSLFVALRSSESYLERSAQSYRTGGNRDAVLDGDHYELWYVQGETESHWSFSDVPAGSALQAPILPLAKWMVRFRSESNNEPVSCRRFRGKARQLFRRWRVCCG